MSENATRPKLKAKRNDRITSSKNNGVASGVAYSGAPSGHSSAGLSRGRATKRSLSGNCEYEKSKKACLTAKDSVTSEDKNKTPIDESARIEQPGHKSTANRRLSHDRTPTNGATKIEQNGSKSTANSRLNKLRENFKKELETKNINNNTKNIKNSNKISGQKSQEKSNSISPRKNLASSRLNRLRSENPKTPKSDSSPETKTPSTVKKRPVAIIDLVTPPEIKENGSSALLHRLSKLQNDSNPSSSTLVNESPLAQRLSYIRNSKNITVRTSGPETPIGLTDSFQVVEEISSPLELEISAQPNQKSPAVKALSVSQRLFRIKKEGSFVDEKITSNCAKPIIRWDSCRMDTISREPSTTSLEEKCDKCLKIATTAQWIDTHQCLSKNQDVDNSISDSLVVNVDDTVLNKTDLIDPDDNSMEWDDIERADTPVNPPVPVEKAKDNIVCVVADTNIFLHNLNKVKDIIFGKFLGSKKLIVYVPWMVIEELDYQKQNAREPLRSLALGAIRYINRCLSDKDSKLKGQSVEDMGLQKDIGQDPDDKILSCAMQAAEKFETVYLLSNDINLRNKAMINKIAACTPNEVISKINNKISQNTNKVKTILLKLRIMCSQVICQCCKDAYGDAWNKMHMLNNAPWSFAECLKRFQKYWPAVFRDKLLKQCSKTVDDLVQIMRETNGTFCDDSEEFNQFMKLALNLCVFLKDIKECKGSVQNTMNEIIKVVENSAE